ncbi:MAG TPA: hypothetical protein VG266_02325 [Candidatus Dormibacteraeota bacterium]|nr:hypothetical protein [Candidatus Dormibacteraeota bacterium]
MGFVRRYWLQVAGVVVGLGIVAAIGVFAFRGSGGSGTAVRTSTTASATPSATADPRVAEVKAAVRAFIAALEESVKTGDPTPLHALTEPGSQADGNAGVPATNSRLDKRCFAATRINFQEASWRVSVTGDSAIASVDYSLVGHEANWPALDPIETDHETTRFHADFSFDRQGGKWLASSLH